MKPAICIACDHFFIDYIDNVYNSIRNHCIDFDLYILTHRDVTKSKWDKWKDRATIINNIDIDNEKLNYFNPYHLIGIKNKIRSISMYFRFLAPHLINTDRLIYTDIDTIFNADITELWNMDLKGNIIAACLDPLRQSPNSLIKDQCLLNKTFQFGYNNTHFASGLIVFDCKKWREENMFYQMANFYNENPMLDMLLMNIVLNNRITVIPDSWCVPCNYMINDKCFITGIEYKDIKCYHWNGEKPWVSKRPYQEVWDKYGN